MLELKKKGGKLRIERHHRRPRSLEGSDEPANVSNVLPKLHRAWHVMFGNMNAEQTANTINSSSKKPKGDTVICVFINGKEVTLRGDHNCKDKAKFDDAWEIVFGDLTFPQSIDYANNVFLDPSYHMYIKK